MIPTKPTITKEHLLDLWNLPWPLIDAMIGGKSSIDLKKLAIKDRDDATIFLASYGFDPRVEKDYRKLKSIFKEALTFIETVLIPKEWSKGLRPPSEIMSNPDAQDLLLWASHGDDKKRAWSCAILRVMHTVVHVDEPLRMKHISVAREQIMSRFKKVLWRDEEARLWFGDAEQRIELADFQWKLGKERQSVLLKLLHKPANVAETIHDYLGVRIITQHLNEALVAVSFLQKFHLVTFANAIPTRARNTLLDVGRFQDKVTHLCQSLGKSQIKVEQFLEAMEDSPEMKHPHKSSNPHSAHSYRAIQLTCRQRIHLPGEDEGGFFFPFEVQIMDRDSGSRVLTGGEASHDRYKHSQLKAVRKRILSEVFKLAY